MATSTVNYSSNTAITIDLANLASQATFLDGRESNQIDNTTNKYIDCLVSGFVSVGTTPTANKTIAIYVWGADTSLATTPIDTLDGTDSTESLANAGILGALRLGAAISVPAATSNVAYPVLPFSVAARFGGIMPKFWGLFVAHDTAVNLRNTSVNTNNFEFVGIKYDIA
jgi:hypothetical protein